VIALEHLDGTISGTHGAAPVGDCVTQGVDIISIQNRRYSLWERGVKKVPRPTFPRPLANPSHVRGMPTAAPATDYTVSPKSHPDISLATQKEDIPFRCEPAQFWGPVCEVSNRVGRRGNCNERLGFDTKIGGFSRIG